MATEDSRRAPVYGVDFTDQTADEHNDIRGSKAKL